MADSPPPDARAGAAPVRRRSIVTHLGVSIAAIAVLAGVFILASAYILRQSAGQAGAINVAGSLRMQTYAIGVELAQPGSSERRSAAVRRALDGFSARYANPALLATLPEERTAALHASYTAVGDYWEDSFRPLALSLLDTGPSEAALQIAPHIEKQVARIDRLVKLIELDLEAKLTTLRALQAGSLLLLCVVTLVMARNIQRRVLAPLADLLQCAAAVRRGDFSVRVAPHGGSDLGELGEAFNFMVRDLSGIYAGMEARVLDKTEQLERSNQALALLYDTTRTLAEASATPDALRQVLRQTETVTGARDGILCACDESGAELFCVTSAGAAAAAVSSAPGTAPPFRVTLADGGRNYGYLQFVLPAGDAAERRPQQLVEAVGRHIGAALAARERAEARHRMALQDERAVIARELHDSLAQALAYQKIQVARINSLLARGERQDQVQDAVEELKVGLNDAHRQLRELLTTFRLRIDRGGLAGALEAAVEEFSRRARLAIRLENRLGAQQLRSGQEIHVLQVVREALNNIERHAAAEHVYIGLDCRDGRVSVVVEDDGRGLGNARMRPHHYGMAIMRDRAQSLGGELEISPRGEGGTRVYMEFSAQPRFE